MVVDNSDIFLSELPYSTTVSKAMWESKAGDSYQRGYCSICDVDVIICPKCGTYSCNGGGCDYCHDAFEEFISTHNGYTGEEV